MGVPAVAHFILPEPAYDLWLKGELREKLGLRRDEKRTRVEIIGGEIVVSPGPLFHHARIASQIQKAFNWREQSDPGFAWQIVQGMDLDLRHIGDGYTPDLMVLTTKEYDDPTNSRARHLLAEQIGMVVEITSKSTAANDREPADDDNADERGFTKWNGYAHEGAGFYLLVDRAPGRACSTLFSEPYLPGGVFRGAKRWNFGETIVLPEPFGVEIPTEDWLTREK